MLWYDDTLVEVGARAIDVLIPPILAGGKPLSKNDLMQAAWSGRMVEANNLSVQIAALRLVLRQASGKDGTFIHTLPGQGYVFVPPVERIAQPSHMEAASEFASSRPVLIEPLTTFIGRTAEIRMVRDLLAGALAFWEVALAFPSNQLLKKTII